MRTLKAKGDAKCAALCNHVVNDLSSHAARQKAFQLPRPYRVLEFSDRLGFDLANALSCDFEDSTDFFKRVRVAVADAVTQLDDFSLAIRQRLEDLLDLVLEHFLGGGFDGVVGFFIFDEVA